MVKEKKTPLSLMSRRIALPEAVTGIILAVLVGVVAGFGAVAFRWLIGEFQWLFFGGGEGVLGFMGYYYVVLLPAAGGLLVGLIIRYGAPEAKGHGVPEVMEAVAVRGGRIRPRVSVVKAFASAICIGSGGSAGREGPIVQIGSSFGSAIGQWLKLSDDWVKTLVACGAAGGISATFNTPIGGVFFAIEIILGRFLSLKFGYVVISAVASSVICHIFLGDKPSFGVIPYQLTSYWEILAYAVLGVLAALAATAFTRLLYKCEDWFDAWHIPGYIKTVVGGLGVGVIGLYSYDLFGVGYGNVFWTSTMSVDHALLGEIALQSLVILFVLKILATSLTIGSGGSGGIFAPSLFIGAMLGGIVGVVVNLLFPGYVGPPGAYALVGMAAVFTGTTWAPITAIIMLFEMTRDYNIVLPLMVAVVISRVVARSLSRENIYTGKLVRRGIDLRQLDQTSPLKEVTVGEAMTHNYPTVSAKIKVSSLVAEMRKTGRPELPVIDGNGNFIGIVTMPDVEAALSKGNPSDLRVIDIVSTNVVVAYPDDYIHDVFVRLGTREVGVVPVVSRTNTQQLLGVLGRNDVLVAYAKAIRRRSREK